MAKTRICSELAALDLLSAVVQMARYDLTRRQVKLEHRVSALELFGLVAEVRDLANGHKQHFGSGPGAGAAHSADVRVKPYLLLDGASQARATAKIGATGGATR